MFSWRKTIALIPLCLALAGCGGDDDDSGESSGGSGGEVAGGAGGEVAGGAGGEVAGGAGGEVAGGAGGGEIFEIDEAALAAQGLAFDEGGFTKVNAERVPSQHGGTMVDFWVSDDIVEAYEAIDPEVDDVLPDIGPGAMVVKAQYTGDGEFDAITMMVKKTEGFDQGTEDWWWARVESDGTASFTGQVDFCINCHTPRAGSGWLFGL